MWWAIKASIKPALKTLAWNLLIGAAVGICVWTGMHALAGMVVSGGFAAGGGVMAANPVYTMLFMSLIQGFAAGFTTLYAETGKHLAELGHGVCLDCGCGGDWLHSGVGDQF